MEALPDLSKLSHEEKDKLILALWDLVQSQAIQIARLEAKVKALEDRLSKNSGNSSKPPATEGFNKPSPKSQRNKNKKKKKVGGQPGHPGKTLNQVEAPHFIENHDPICCWLCSHTLLTIDRLDYESRQVFDLPSLNLEVTEHRAYQKQCGHCGIITKGSFPGGIEQPAQYGSKIKGLMVYMGQYQLLPFDRTREFFFDVFNQTISVGTIKRAIKMSAAHLLPAEKYIKDQLIIAPVLHGDETGFRVNNHSYWLHVCCTSKLTFYAAHKKRGRLAMDEINLLPQFKGTLVHDHLKSYFQYGTDHGLCNAHHLRELTFIQERYEHQWAKKIENLLLRIKKSAERHYDKYGGPMPDRNLKRYRSMFMNILAEGKKECPRNSVKQRGRIKQTQAWNLLDRLRQFNRAVLAFMYNPAVPFDNNQAERDIRMMKVQQKISGCFRTVEGVEHFCRIRGYISTAKKQGVSAMVALQKAIENQPIMFNA